MHVTRDKRNKGLKRVLGALATDIRGDWSSDVTSRLETMIEICQELNEQGYIDAINKNEDVIVGDGRWFRDEWEGPYGATSLLKVGRGIYDEFWPEFNNPLSYFVDETSAPAGS